MLAVQSSAASHGISIHASGSAGGLHSSRCSSTLPLGRMTPRVGRLHELHADPADSAEGVRAPVAGRALDDDSKTLLEFRRRLGDPVRLSKISACSLVLPLPSTPPNLGCGHLADLPGAATSCLGWHSVHHTQQDALDRDHLPGRARHRAATESVQKSPLR